MALAKGSKAPDFTLPGTSGKDFSLYTVMKGKPCVLYFYPKDFTSVCTAEACGFRDHFEDFRDLDITVLGISTDDIATHNRFKEQFNLPFELLSDADGSVSKLYGAKMPILNMSKRITYLLDGEQRVQSTFSDLFNAKKHIQSVLEEMKGRK
jgi:peroxiredoxin Q/BCP